MNAGLSVSELAQVRKQLLAEPAAPKDVTTSVSRSGVAVLISCLGWTFLGTALFFTLYALLARDQNPTGTLIAAYISGLVGVLVSSLWLRNLSGFGMFLLAIMTAYSMRVLVGVFLCLQVYNPNYLDGDGKYLNKNWEFRWTYQNVMVAADSVLHKGEWRPSKIYPTYEDKNAYIHAWMGYFMAAGDSRNSLDLGPFNAFHHVIAGILVVSLALACGYPLKVAFQSGVLVSWIPWAFASSIMWRDSVGLAWVVLAVVLLCLGRELGLIASLLSAIPAAFLAWADRSPYLLAVVLITGLSIVYDQQKSLQSTWTKLPRLIIVSILLFVGVYLLWHNIASVAFERHAKIVTDRNMSFRLMTSPLLVLRALAGPFPWFVGSKYDPYVLFDYLFHVFQFAIFLIYIRKWRSIMSNINILTYSAAIFWFFGFIAGGVHTAYLVVATPFVLPPVLNTGATLWKYVLLSALFFAAANVLYVSVGLVGSGLVLGTTGY